MSDTLPSPSEHVVFHSENAQCEIAPTPVIRLMPWRGRGHNSLAALVIAVVILRADAAADAAADADADAAAADPTPNDVQCAWILCAIFHRVARV